VQHRLRIASGADRPIFTHAALASIHRYSRGIPRVINVLCDRCLLAGYGEQAAQIGASLVRRVAREIRLDRRPAWLPSRAVLTAVAGIFVAAIASAVLLRGVQAPPPVVWPTQGLSQGAAAPPAASVARAHEPSSSEALDDLLALQSPTAATTAALAAMLRAWGVSEEEVRATSFPGLLSQLEARGMRTLSLSSLDEMRFVDLPVLLRLRGGDRHGRTALLRNLSRESAFLEAIVSGQVVRLGVDDLERRWERPGYAVWRDPARLPATLSEGASGPPVVWLQSKLAQLGHYGGPRHGRLDPDTRAALAQFQRARGLPADGEFGPGTQIRLYRALPEYRVPALVADGSTRAASTP
jgi:general secretion pathway protein A